MKTNTTQTDACRRCGLDLSPPLEQQEALVVEFRAGYGSVVGDGNVVSTTLCQHCVRDLLGASLAIDEDDPFRPAITLCPPRRAFQPDQLRRPTGCARSGRVEAWGGPRTDGLPERATPRCKSCGRIS